MGGGGGGVQASILVSDQCSIKINNINTSIIARLDKILTESMNDSL